MTWTNQSPPDIEAPTIICSSLPQQSNLLTITILYTKQQKQTPKKQQLFLPFFPKTTKNKRHSFANNSANETNIFYTLL